MLSGCLADAKPMLSQNSIEENSIEENRIEENSIEEGTRGRKNKVNDFIDTYSQKCPKLPQIRTITDSRKRAITLFSKTYTLKDWEEVCEKASESDFLLRCKRQRLESGF